MSLRTYLVPFMAMAILFVPVVFFYFFGTLVAPCCYLLFETTFLWRWERVSFLMLGYLLLYLAVFLGLGWVTYRLSQWRAITTQHRVLRQSAFLALVISCSFIPIISTSDSGTYDFWTACVRYAQAYWPDQRRLLGF